MPLARPPVPGRRCEQEADPPFMRRKAVFPALLNAIKSINGVATTKLMLSAENAIKVMSRPEVRNANTHEIGTTRCYVPSNRDAIAAQSNGLADLSRRCQYSLLRVGYEGRRLPFLDEMPEIATIALNCISQSGRQSEAVA
jgi:hypothetical protein